MEHSVRPVWSANWPAALQRHKQAQRTELGVRRTRVVPRQAKALAGLGLNLAQLTQGAAHNRAMSARHPSARASQGKPSRRSGGRHRASLQRRAPCAEKLAGNIGTQERASGPCICRMQGGPADPQTCQRRCNDPLNISRRKPHAQEKHASHHVSQLDFPPSDCDLPASQSALQNTHNKHA